MKKILLIITIVLCIFQMVVMATEITIGETAADRAFTWSAMTCVIKGNPEKSANASGKITSVEIWANIEMADCEVATFFVVSLNNLSTRDYETVDNGNGAGVVLAGSKQTFVVDLDVEEGDFIGIYFSAGKLERDNTGGYFWYLTGDNIPCTNETFNINDDVCSVYGTGTTEVGEEVNVIFFGTNF